MIPAGPDPTTTTSHDFSHHAISDEDDVDADSDTVEAGVPTVEEVVLCALTEIIKETKNKRCIEMEGETINGNDVENFNPKTRK